MKAVVVGGHTRNIGKTSVVAALIHELAALRWTAVKITQYGHGVCSLDGKACECEPREHAFVLTEERKAGGRSDTSRYLAAGAKRSLWLRARQDQLAGAFPILQRALATDEYVIIESNSILGLMSPAVYLMVLDSSAADFKPSALRYLERADAFIPIEFRYDARVWPALPGHLLQRKPVFPVSASNYCSPELSGFVLQKIGRVQADPCS